MTAFNSIEGYENSNDDMMTAYLKKVPATWIIAAFIISFGAAYLAYECSSAESAATRAIYTLFAFFFSGIYLIYYFIVHIVLGYQCFDGKNISNIMKSKK